MKFDGFFLSNLTETNGQGGAEGCPVQSEPRFDRDILILTESFCQIDPGPGPELFLVRYHRRRVTARGALRVAAPRRGNVRLAVLAITAN